MGTKRVAGPRTAAGVKILARERNFTSTGHRDSETLVGGVDAALKLVSHLYVVPTLRRVRSRYRQPYLGRGDAGWRRPFGARRDTAKPEVARSDSETRVRAA